MQNSDLKYVKIEKQDGIAWTYLNRPEKKNAMNPGLHMEMNDVLDFLERDPATQVVVIAGAGGNFSAGQDLKEYFRALEGKRAEAKQTRLVANRWQWDKLYMFDKPTIAMVEGYCVGGAFSHLLACDFVVASSDATFSLSEVNWGILPGGMVSKALVDAVLYRHALYYACLGEPFDGPEAVRIGIANISADPDKVKSETETLAKKLMSKSAAALRATKQAIRQVRQMSMDQASDYLQEKRMAIQVGDQDNSYHSGLEGFLDKKSYKPVFQSFKQKGE